jgi:hypothetical protein
MEAMVEVMEAAVTKTVNPAGVAILGKGLDGATKKSFYIQRYLVVPLPDLCPTSYPDMHPHN